MTSLKAKLVLALISTSLLVVIIIAIMTPIMVEHEFVEHAKDAHYGRFQAAIERYIRENNSWDTEKDALRFAIAEENSRKLHRKPRNPPPMRPQGQGDAPYFSGLPPPMQRPDANASDERPFAFVLTDTQGHILHGGKDYKIGQKLTEEELSGADSLWLKGRLVAYALSSGEPDLSAADLAYLHTLRETLFFSALGAIVFIIPFGIWEGSRLVRTLNHLTSAVNRMAEGDFKQQVPVKSEDEVGALAKAFNLMNTQLHEAYKNLEDSRNKVAKQAEQLRELSIRDELTGLYNRRFFNEEVKVLHANALRYGNGFCLVLGDIDFFKRINDGYSHVIGDEVLKQVSKILMNSIRNSDIVARYGGEEMVLALPNTSPKAAMEMMERIRKAIEQHPWEQTAEGLTVTMSFGICDETNGEHFEHMLAVADELLYKAKNNGRNQVCSLSCSQVH
ncbi:diguanylate cyclase [Hahella sp. CR1]|uniref:diguanylate cyclase n=1 Tax=unclassified Hahella TaxID=2624107 RepID=UPI0024426E78|nr:diguanylate cyclase [Hahella sp. CR1]MDG9670081.1 diguanylate cyclase [Hahella sp. CR1]